MRRVRCPADGVVLMFRRILVRPWNVRIARILWGVFVVIVCIIVALPSHHRTVTLVLRHASIGWFEGQDIYAPSKGFLYLPQSAILFAPFAYLPFHTSEVLWRIVCLGGMATAIWRLARLATSEGNLELFPLMSLVAIPPAMDSARNGQMNIPLAALMVLAAVDLADNHWWRATLWMTLGLALKPLMIVMILLGAALYRPMSWRLPIALVIVLSLPFLTQDPAYVIRQYEASVNTMLVASNPGPNILFSDFFELLQSLDVHVQHATETAVRAITALLTLGLAWLGRRRWGHVRGAVLVLALASCYLMLFNPRTENNSYVILGPSLAVFAAWAFLVDRWYAVGWALVAVTMGVAGSYEITRGPNHWLSPSLCLAFLAYIVYLVLADRRPATTTPSSVTQGRA